MKKKNLFKVAFMSVILAGLLVIAGCTSSDNIVFVPVDTPVPAASTNVVVQLQLQVASADVLSTNYLVHPMTVAGTTPYPYLVDQMSVSIQKAGGPILTGTTGTDGIARIPVTETGNYEVIQVTGVDATNLTQGSEAGREFKKENPITSPFPNLTYTFGGSFPTVSVTALGSDYTVNAPVPTIIKVTVLKAGTATSDDDIAPNVTAGTAAFAGRVMLRNFYCDDQRARIRIQSNDPDYNRLMLGIDESGVPVTGIFRGDSSGPVNIGTFGSYPPGGWIYFEAPGTDSGDWALGYISNTLITRDGLGSGSDPTVNFPLFNGGNDNFVFQLTPGANYNYDYRIFQFDEYPGPSDGIE